METKVIKEEPDFQKDQLKQKTSKGKEDIVECPRTPSVDGSANNTPCSSPVESHEPIQKMKRLLCTLVNHVREINPETGEKVAKLVLALVAGNMTLDDFQKSLQEAANCPLRPFVVPFLLAYLPVLQKEVAHLARSSKQGVLEYLTTHPNTVLDPQFSPGQTSEVFGISQESVKRRLHHDRLCEGNWSPPLAKRPLLVPVHPLASNGSAASTSDLEYGNTSFGSNMQRARSPPQCAVGTGQEEQWRNIHVMLNCILSMVEKTKAALGMLQGRTGCSEEIIFPQGKQLDLETPSLMGNLRPRSHSSDMMAHTIRLTEDRVAQVKKKAEEAVAEVKRKALIELQRAVTAAENRTAQIVAAERARLDKLVQEARREDPEPMMGCWNCGRKAHETCSGCNMARYCSSFCQHKDWQSHHESCGARQNSTLTKRPQLQQQQQQQSQPPQQQQQQPTQQSRRFFFLKLSRRIGSFFFFSVLSASWTSSTS
ncbi:CBFA2/RUNX1 partner transcriptional co-repressor nervy isoform X2 [Rhodnius prolixus]